jgi:DNA ligase-1
MGGMTMASPAKSVLLAPNELPRPEDLTYPLLASLKYDGNRHLRMKGVSYTRSLKVQPNKNLSAHLPQLSAATELVWDGELWSPKMSFSELQTIIRAKDKPIPEHVKFYIFDMMTLDEWNGECSTPFARRSQNLAQWFWEFTPRNCEYVRQELVTSATKVRMLYAEALEAGFEGLILRDPNAGYKHGRATIKEGSIFKQKPFDLLDAKVIGFEQQKAVREDAVRTTNELGRTAKTSKKADFTVADNIGALHVRDEKGREFSIGWGRGWDMAKRKELWDDRASLVGRWVEVRFMAVGEKALPRMPQLIRFRDDKE